MKRKLPIILLIVLLLAAISCTYSINEKEYVAVRQFGKIVAVKSEPGLQFKIPFIQNVQRISASTKIYDLPVSDVITKDKKTMIADNYVLWYVSDPTTYIKTLNAVDNRAIERIEAAVYNATKNVISSMTQDEIIAARGEHLTTMITEKSNSGMSAYGITIIQSQIKTLDLPDDNKAAVYERMISERQNIAASYTAEGSAEAQKIRNATDKETAVMKAEAQKQAAVLEAEGESKYMEILQDAYNTSDKADFYNYIRSLDAFKASLNGDNKTIILDKDSEIAKTIYGVSD